MKTLIIGGSGTVGTLVVPILAQTHAVRVFDLHAPGYANVEHVQGDALEYADLAKALAGMDGLVYMTMGSLDWAETRGVVSAFDLNIKGLHLALRAAHEAGLTQAVYTSSMSIYAGDLTQRTFPDEDVTPDSTGLYGFTKRLGEEVCRNAARLWGMHVNALRLCWPVADDKWPGESAPGSNLPTAASDVARAIAAALEFRGGFQAFMISGDYENKIMHMDKARRLLGWEPLARPA
jgi:nucleoside-diphosphate-sugar epimerase